MNQSTNGAVGDVVGRPALSRLVAGEVDDFAASTWGREPSFARADTLPESFDDLFSPAAVDELVAERGLRTPFLRVAKNGTTLGDRAFTAGGGVGAGVTDQLSDDKLTALFADGSTLVLQALHRTWPPLIEFVQQLAADLGHPVQANAYVTPPQSQGFDDHYDVHDVFVLQIEGEKRWRIHRPVHDAPLRDEPWTDHRAEVAAAAETEPLIDEVLRPGDCLYLPRGFLHAATALGDVSTHITLGVHTWTRYALAQELARLVLEDLAKDVDARRSLPLGIAVEDQDAIAADLGLVRDRLAESLAKIDSHGVTNALASAWRDSGRAAPIGPLEQLRTAQRLSSEDRVRLRRHLVPQLRTLADGSGVLETRAGVLELAPDELGPVRRLVDDGAATVLSLGTGLAQRLVRAAVVVRAE